MIGNASIPAEMAMEAAPTGSVLYQLAEEHVARATVAAANELNGENSGPENEEMRAAIRCLQACIAKAPRDVRARTLLATLLSRYTDNEDEAEHQLGSALQSATELNNTDAYYGVIFHQFQLFALTNRSKMAEDLCSKTLKELVELNMPDWFYRFGLAYADMLATGRNPRKCLSHLESMCAEAEKRRHLDVCAVLLLAKARVAIQHQDFLGAGSALQRCNKLFSAPSSTDAMDVDGSPTIDPFAVPKLDSEGAAVTNKELRLYLAVLSSLFLLHIGRTNDAVSWLRGDDGIDKVLDPESAGESALSQDTISGLVTVSLSLAESQSQAPEEVQIQISFLPRSQLHCLAWLAAGVAKKSGSPSVAKKFLAEGLMRIDGALRNLGSDRVQRSGPADIRAEWDWLMNCKVNLLLNLCDVLVLRSECTDAQAYMTILGNILVRNQQLMDRWKQTFFLSWGVLRQSMGEMSESLPWLEGAADPEASDDDVRSAALINMCLIYLGPKCEDVGRASHICDYLVRHFADKAGGSYPEVQSSAVKFAEAGVLLRRGEIQKAKASVLEALATAEAANAIQLKSMVLSLAGILFLDSDPNKAEAMLTFAKQVAGDAKLDMIAAGAASSLQTLFAQTNRPEKAEKMGKQAEKFQAAHVKRQQPKTGHFEN